MVETLPSYAGGEGLIPGQGTKVLNATGYGQKLKINEHNIVNQLYFNFKKLKKIEMVNVTKEGKHIFYFWGKFFSF